VRRATGLPPKVQERAAQPFSRRNKESVFAEKESRYSNRMCCGRVTDGGCRFATFGRLDSVLLPPSRARSMRGVSQTVPPCTPIRTTRTLSQRSRPSTSFPPTLPLFLSLPSPPLTLNRSTAPSRMSPTGSTTLQAGQIGSNRRSNLIETPFPILLFPLNPPSTLISLRPVPPTIDDPHTSPPTLSRRPERSRITTPLPFALDVFRLRRLDVSPSLHPLVQQHFLSYLLLSLPYPSTSHRADKTPLQFFPSPISSMSRCNSSTREKLRSST
jgi:hypothetical protein